MLTCLDRVGDVGQLALAREKRIRHVATIRRRRGSGAVDQRNGRDQRKDHTHASPPARSASGDLTREPGLRPSITLYHDIRLATAIMIIMPMRLMAIWVSGPPEYSLMTNWPAKAKNTPRQKISSECWPHRMAGCRIGDFRPGQSRGMNRTVTVASARKWAKRSTSRLVLSIGYIHSLSQLGTMRPSGSMYQVSVMTKAKSR